MAINFAALWPTGPKFLAVKDLYPFSTMYKVQEDSRILRMGFYLSKWPHLLHNMGFVDSLTHATVGCLINVQGTLQDNGLISVISWYTGENWELKWILPRNIPRFCLNQNLFLPIVFVTKKFEKFALMWRHFFIKIEKNNFSLTFLPDLLTSNGSGKLILKLSQTKPFLAF